MAFLRAQEKAKEKESASEPQTVDFPSVEIQNNGKLSKFIFYIL